MPRMKTNLLKLYMLMTLACVVMGKFCAEADPSDGIKDCPCDMDADMMFTCDAIYYKESCQGDNWPGDLTGKCGS